MSFDTQRLPWKSNIFLTPILLSKYEKLTTFLVDMCGKVGNNVTFSYEWVMMFNHIELFNGMTDGYETLDLWQGDIVV